MVMRQLRIMYFTQPAFLDAALCLTRALSSVAHVALVIEMGPEQLSSSAIPLPPHGFGAGIHECSDYLDAALPAEFRKYWRSAASVHAIVYDSPHSLGMHAQAIARRAPRLADAFGADVVHLEAVSLRLAPTMVLQRRYPVVVNIHDPCPHPGASNRKNDVARAALVRRADVVVLHNRAQYEYFASRHPRCRHVACIRLAPYDLLEDIQVSDGAPSDQPAAPYALFFGRVESYKGVDVLLSAAELLADRLPGARVVVAGRDRTGRWASARRPPNVDWLVGPDRVSLQDSVALIRSSRVVVAPYTQATQSGVVLSAYGLGVPVIATRVGGLPEYIRNGVTGLLVEPGNADELAEAMALLISDDALQARMRRAIAEARRSWLGWEMSARRWAEVYHDALVPRRALRCCGVGEQ